MLNMTVYYNNKSFSSRKAFRDEVRNVLGNYLFYEVRRYGRVASIIAIDKRIVNGAKATMKVNNKLFDEYLWVNSGSLMLGGDIVYKIVGCMYSGLGYRVKLLNNDTYKMFTGFSYDFMGLDYGVLGETSSKDLLAEYAYDNKVFKSESELFQYLYKEGKLRQGVEFLYEPDEVDEAYSIYSEYCKLKNS